MNRTVYQITKSDQRIYRTASVTVILLAVSAAILSYSALKTLAFESGIGEILSYLFPIIIDGLILSGSLLVLYAANRGRRSWGGFFLTGLGVVSSIAGNVAVSPNDLTARLVHAAAPIVLFLALEATTSLIRQMHREREAFNESQTDTPISIDQPNAHPQLPVPPLEEEQVPTQLTENTVSTLLPIMSTPKATPRDPVVVPDNVEQETQPDPQEQEEQSSVLLHDSVTETKSPFPQLDDFQQETPKEVVESPKEVVEVIPVSEPVPAPPVESTANQDNTTPSKPSTKKVAQEPAPAVKAPAKRPPTTRPAKEIRVLSVEVEDNLPIAQKIRAILDQDSGATPEEIANFINHRDPKYVRKTARQEIAKRAA